MRRFRVIVVLFCLVVGIDNAMALNMKQKVRILESRVNTLELQNQGIFSNSERISNLNETVMGLDQCSPDERDTDTQNSDGQRGNVKMEYRDENQQNVDILRAFTEEKAHIRQFEQHLNEGFSAFKKEMRKTTAQENATMQNMIENFSSTFDDLHTELNTSLKAFASSFDDLQTMLNASLNVLEMKQTEDTESLKSYIDQMTSEQIGLKTIMNEIKLYINRENDFDHWWKDCHSGWTKRKGFLYKYFSEEATYAKARQMCASCNSHVVDVQDKEEMAFVLGLAGVSFWLGATDMTTEGRWIWDRTGKEVTYQ